MQNSTTHKGVNELLESCHFYSAINFRDVNDSVVCTCCPLLYLYFSFADMVRSIFEMHGICSTDGRSFNPHLTIAKVSKSSGRDRIYGIEKEVYSEFMDTELGSEVVTGLELLSMVEPAAADGYYHCLQRYTFEEISRSSQRTCESLESRVASLRGSPLHSSPHGEEPQNEPPLHSSLHREEPGSKANS